MALHVRQVEDSQDQELVNRGWKMAGASLWKHDLFPYYFTKDKALEVDLNNYHSAEVEQPQMLEFIGSLLHTDVGDVRAVREAARKFLASLGYKV